MIGKAVTAKPYALGFDCYAPTTAAVCRAFKQDGYTWVARYLEDLTQGEVEAIFQEGLLIAPLTTAPAVPLDGNFGLRAGDATVLRAQRLGVPPNVHVTIDLEATGHSTARDVVAYVQARAVTIAAAGFANMLYVGAGQPLNGQELYSLKPDRYWHAGSRSIAEPPCGFAVLQLSRLDRIIHGQQVDVDVTQEDFRGRLPIFWGGG